MVLLWHLLPGSIDKSEIEATKEVDMASKMITVLDPMAESTKKEFPMAIRPDKLEGKVMGVIWNTMPNGDILLNRFTELLDKRFHFAQVLRHTKISQVHAITEDILNEFSTKCDFVITGPGD